MLIFHVSLPADQNLEAHGSHALTSIAASGSATIGRSFGHTLRRAVSIRRSHAPRDTRHLSGGKASHHRHSAGQLPEEGNRHSGTFVDLRPNSSYDPETVSNRSSVISSSSVSTISSNNPASSATPTSATPIPDKHHLSAVQRAGGGAESPEALRNSSPHFYTDSSSSSTSSLRAGGKSPLMGGARSPLPLEHGGAEGAGPSPNPVLRDQASSTSSLDSMSETLLHYDTPV